MTLVAMPLCSATPVPVSDQERRALEASASVGTASVLERLVDAPRPGTPPTFTPEVICSIIALACEPPSRDGRELTHWALDDLAAEAVARDIVKCLSARSIGRFLREADLKPHRTRGWINTPRDEDFDETCQDVCETYRLAPERAAAGVGKSCHTCAAQCCCRVFDRCPPAGVLSLSGHESSGQGQGGTRAVPLTADPASFGACVPFL